MAEEAQPFLDALPERAGARPPALLGAARAWSLQLPDSERELILVRSGIGLVAAASALAATLAQVRPGAVISAGTTGGLGRQVEVGDVCASASLAYTDADATAFGYVRGQTPGQPETFAGDPALLERLEQVGPEALLDATASSDSAHLHVGQMLAGSSFVTAANVADSRAGAAQGGGRSSTSPPRRPPPAAPRSSWLCSAEELTPPHLIDFFFIDRPVLHKRPGAASFMKFWSVCQPGAGAPHRRESRCGVKADVGQLTPHSFIASSTGRRLLPRSVSS